jgi:SAM-dependent methyltransferase
MKRLRIPELMDDPNLPEEDHRAALEGLKQLNKISSSARLLWNALTQIAAASDSTRKDKEPLRVLDIATGSGDMLVALSQYSQRQESGNTHFHFTGVDISPTALKVAQNNAQRAGADIDFLTCDVMNEPISSGFDILMTSLFTHHLDPDGVHTLFKKVLESDARAFIVNDLVRSTLSFSLVWLASRILTSSHIVHFDAPVSVRAAYTPDELREMALNAGLLNSHVELHPPCRQLLIWRRS